MTLIRNTCKDCISQQRRTWIIRSRNGSSYRCLNIRFCKGDWKACQRI